jgi:hypothetical protein
MQALSRPRPNVSFGTSMRRLGAESSTECLKPIGVAAGART